MISLKEKYSYNIQAHSDDAIDIWHDVYIQILRWRYSNPQTISIQPKSDKILFKLDQGALGMSDPCGTLQFALKPNSVPRINTLLSNFYICANWYVVPCQMVGLKGPMGSW